MSTYLLSPGGAHLVTATDEIYKGRPAYRMRCGALVAKGLPTASSKPADMCPLCDMTDEKLAEAKLKLGIKD